ncbi:MAG: protein kinase domain-containing protein [Isosphaeraceae bacterium]
MASGSSEQFVLLDRLGQEFADRFRRGERPSLQEYIDRHPELADEIREFFPAMVEIEQVKDDREELAGPSASGPLPPLGRLGDYRIIREIGRGGMGVVYEAEQVSLGRHVALKVLPAQLLAHPKTRQRFEREARSAARLHHTNIVPVFGFSEHEGLPYYVMQFIQGSGLDEVLEELERLQAAGRGPGGDSPETRGASSPAGKRWPPGNRAATAAEVARSLWTGRFVPFEEIEATQVASAVIGATEPRPAVSPDPAPSPVPAPPPSTPSPVGGMLSDSFIGASSAALSGSASGSRGRRGRRTYWQSVARVGVQVADALQHAHAQGILHRDIKPSNLLLDTDGVVWVADFGLAKAADQQDLTHTGDILGTLRYMPPEAFDGKADHRGDVYSLGLTLYELLALRPAFDDRDRNRLIKRVTSEEPDRLDRINPAIPRDLVTVVHKAIEREPSHRYATAAELMADLQRFVDDEPILARRQTSMERLGRWARRHRGIAWLGGFLTAAVVLLIVGSLVAAGWMKVERDAANSARLRESGERARADLTRKEAQASEARARAALRQAEESYARARGAVRDYLTAVSDDPKLKAPGLSPLRARLLQSALRFYQEFLNEKAEDPALRRELAEVHYKVGDIFRDLGQRASAMPSFARAQQLYEALAAESPEDAGLRDGLARVLYERGEYERAIALWEALIRPDDPRYHADLGWAYNNAADIAGARRDSAKTLDYLRKALDVCERLVRLRPDDWQAHAGLSASLNNIASALDPEAHAADQLALHRRAAAEGEVAYKLRPSEPVNISNLIVQTANLARAASNRAALDEALAAYRRLAEIL